KIYLHHVSFHVLTHDQRGMGINFIYKEQDIYIYMLTNPYLLCLVDHVYDLSIIDNIAYI
ncbi:hypothetical protein ACJX0J_036034, partial [Zea mays]